MNKPSKKFTQAIVIIFAAWIVSIGIIYIKAWVGPSSAPATNKGAIAVDSSGNVGIGTTDPAGYKLNVNGTIKAAGMIESTTGGVKFPDATVQTTAAASTTGIWKLIDSKDISTDVTSVSFIGLNGDTDIEYKLIMRIIGTNSVSYYLRLNGDTAANYGYQMMRAVNGTVSSPSASNATNIYIGDNSISGAIFLAEILIDGKSGYNKSILGSSTGKITGTTVNQINNFGGVWNNTAAVSSIDLVGDMGYGFVAGSRLELWARR